MARQSLKADPLDDAVQYLRETLATTTEEYERGEQQAHQLRSELETVESEQEKRRANHERILTALRALEEPSVGSGNGQDISEVTAPSAPHLVALPVDDWDIVELGGEPEQPHTEPVEEPPPEAA